MLPIVLCLIILAMPFAIAVCAAASFAAWAEPRPVSAKAYWRRAEVGDGVVDVDDDGTLFR
jgi:hypothetical protein